MTKYKIVGILNLFLGILETIYPLFAFMFTIPRLTELYSEFGAEGPSFGITYLTLSIIILMGIGNLFFGIKLFSKTENKDKYFKYALILVIASFLLGGVFTSFASLSVIMPIYNLTSQF